VRHKAAGQLAGRSGRWLGLPRSSGVFAFRGSMGCHAPDLAAALAATIQKPCLKPVAVLAGTPC